MKTQIVLGALVLAASTAISSAVVVVTTGNQNNGTTSLQHTYVPSTTDLINGLAPTASAGNFTQEGTGGIPVLTDGQFASPLTRDPSGPFAFSSFATGGNNGGTSLTYTLGSPANIASIDVFGGWQDSGRDEQSYSVFYALAGAPATFTLLTTVSYNATGLPATTPVANKVTISDTTGILVADVAALRFNFNATENGYAGYSEIDVNAVPEPAALGMLGLAGLGLRVRRRR